MQSENNFPFSINDVVLADWERKLYYAKILSINHLMSKCRLLFDDGSSGNVHFSQIHNVNETTAEIHCVVCKEDNTSPGNEIVLCDSCSVGYHQKCHEPFIPADALEFFTPWICSYCNKEESNPHIEKNPFERRQEKEENNKKVGLGNENSVKQASNTTHHKHNCKADSAESEASMKKGCGHQERKARRSIERRHDDFTSFGRDALYSKNGDKKGHPFKFEGKRAYEATKYNHLDQSSCYRKRSAGSPRHSRKDWERWDRSRIDYHENLRRNSRSGGRDHSLRISTKSFSHEGRYNGRDYPKIEPRGSKQQRTKLRDKLAKRYVPDHYLFGFSNKRSARDVPNNNNYNSRETRRKLNGERRSHSYNELMDFDSSHSKEIHNHEKPRNECSKSSGSLSKRIKLDSEILCKPKTRDNENPCSDKKQNDSGRQESCNNSESAKPLKDDNEIVVNSVAGSKFEESKSPKVSKPLQIAHNESSKENDTTNRTRNGSLFSKDLSKKDDVDCQGMKSNFSEERSAFKYVKQCLLKRPGSSIKHQQELLVNYKNSAIYENDKVSQCKHSDAVEIGKEFMNGECTDSECTHGEDTNGSVSNKCDDAVFNGEKNNFGTHNRHCTIEDSIILESESPVDDKSTSKKEDSVNSPEDDALETCIDDTDLGNNEDNKISLVASNYPSHSSTRKDNNTMENNTKKSTYNFDYTNCSSRNDGDYKNEEAKSSNSSDNQIDDGDFRVEKARSGKTQGTRDDTASFSASVMKQQIITTSNNGSLSFGEKLSTTKSSAISSSTKSFNYSSRMEESLTEGACSPTFEKVSCSLMNQNKREFKKTEDGADICDGVSSEKAGYVPAKNEHTFLITTAEPRMSVVCEDTKATVELDSRGEELINNANDSSIAPALAKKIVQGRSSNSIVGDEKKLDVRNDNSERFNYRSAVQVAESGFENQKSIVDKTGVKKDNASYDIDSKISVSESYLPNSFSSTIFRNNEHTTGVLANSSSKDLIVEWDSKDDGSSLGIRISDVFSLKREQSDSKGDEYKSVAEYGNDEQESGVEEKRGSLRKDIYDHVEQGRNLGEAKRHSPKNTSLKFEGLEPRRSSEHSVSSLCHDGENRCKEDIGACEGALAEVCHAHEVDNLMEREYESPCEKVGKVQTTSVVSVNSAPLSEDCQHEQSTKRKRKKRKIRAISSPCDTMQSDRILLDLPRHNWLIERLLSEKKLDSETIEGDKPPVALQEDEKKPKSRKRKKKNSQDSEAESDKVKVSKERLEARDITLSCKGINFSEENSDSSAESIESIERLSENMSKEMQIIKEKTAKPINVADNSKHERNNGKSSEKPDSPVFDTAIRSKEHRSKSNEVVTTSQQSLKISIPNFNLERRESKGNQLPSLPASPALSESCKSNRKTSPHLSYTDENCGSKKKSEMALTRNEYEEMHLEKRETEIPQVTNKEKYAMTLENTFKEDKVACGDGAQHKITDDSEVVIGTNRDKLAGEERCRNEKKSEIEKDTRVVRVEKTCVISESFDSRILPIESRSPNINRDITSMDQNSSDEKKDENHCDRNTTMTVSLEAIAETNTSCSIDTLSNSSLPTKQSESKTSGNKRLEAPAQQQAPLQKEKENHSNSMPSFKAQSLHHGSNEYQNHSAFIHSKMDKESHTQWTLSQNPDEVNSRQNFSYVSQFPDKCDSHPIDSVVSHKHVPKAIGELTHERDKQPQSHVKNVAYQVLRKEPRMQPNLRTVDPSHTSPPRLDVNNEKSRDTSCDISHERSQFPQKIETKERGLNKASLDEKAEIILSIIEDTSISDSTKQELVDYWRSIRKINSHSNSEAGDRKSRIPHFTTGEANINRFHPISVSQNKPPLHGSKVADDTSSKNLLEETDNQSRHSAPKVPEQVIDVQKHPNEPLHPSARYCDQRSSPTLGRHELGGLSASVNRGRKEESNLIKSSSSGPAFSNSETEEMRRRKVEKHEIPYSMGYSRESAFCLSGQHLHPENGVYHRNFSKIHHMDGSRVIPKLSMEPETSVLRKHSYGHVNSNVDVLHSKVPLHTNERGGDANIREFPLTENHVGGVIFPNYTRRQRSLYEQEMLWQREMNYQKQSKMKGKYGGHRFCKDDMAQDLHIEGHAHQKGSRMGDPHEFMQKLNGVEQPRHKQPNLGLSSFQNMPALQLQDNDHLQQHPFTQQQMQLHHRQPWQHESQHRNFNQGQGLQLPQHPVQQRSHHEEQSHFRKNQDMQDMYHVNHLQQRIQGQIMKQEEPRILNREFKDGKPLSLNYDKISLSSEERYRLKHFHETEQDKVRLKNYERCKVYERRQIMQHGEEFIENSVINSHSISTFNYGSQSPVYKLPQAQTPLKQQLHSLYLKKSESLVEPCYENHSQMTYSQAQANSRHTSPHFDTSKRPTRPVVNCKGYNDDAICQCCGNKAKFLCSRCRRAWYCSEGCQLKEWKTHCKSCKIIPNAKESVKY